MINLFKLFSSFLSPYSMADIDPVVAYTMVEEGRGVLIDSREKEDLQNGMIDGAFSIPNSMIANESVLQRLNNLRERQIKIFIYGDSEQSSADLKEFLLAHRIDATDLGTFESLEEILPVKFLNESSGMSEGQMF